MKSQDFSMQHQRPPVHCICTCPKVWDTCLSIYACPKHVHTDHPVLVYKTCEIEQTVLRLFSCLPPPLSPHKFTFLSPSFAFTLCISSFGSITSTFKPLSLPTALHKVVSRDRFEISFFVGHDALQCIYAMCSIIQVIVVLGFPFIHQ